MVFISLILMKYLDALVLMAHSHECFSFDNPRMSTNVYCAAGRRCGELLMGVIIGPPVDRFHE